MGTQRTIRYETIQCDSDEVWVARILKSDFLEYKNFELEEWRIKAIWKFPIFSNMKEKDLKALVYEEWVYPLGAVVYHQGDETDGVYLNVEGEFEIF